MNKKKLILFFAISIVLNIVFYLEGQRLQLTKKSLENDIAELKEIIEAIPEVKEEQIETPE